MSIKALLIDADGVLIVGETFSSRLEREHNITLADTKDFFAGPFQDCLLGKLDMQSVLPEYLANWGWTDTPEAFMEYWFDTQITLNQDLLADLESRRATGMPSYLATNQETHRAEYLRDDLGFANAFDGMYVSAWLGVKKPFSEFFQALIADIGLDPSELLFWDDDPKNVAAAQSAGIQAEVYTTHDDYLAKMKARDL